MKRLEELITPILLPIAVCIGFGFLTQLSFNTIMSNFFSVKEMKLDTGVAIWVVVFMLVFLKNLLFQNEAKETINYNHIMTPPDLGGYDEEIEGNLP